MTDAHDHQARLDLAALFRLFCRFGWTDLTYTHLTARVPSRPDHYFTNAYGLLFSEVCASNLVEVDARGTVVGVPTALNKVGAVVHSSILTARPEINFVLHSHTTAGISVSAMECGLLPISQHASAVLGTTGYHAYSVIHDTAEDRERLVADLADNHLLIMRNHGLLACGRTPGEAFLYLYFLERACAIQVDACRSGLTLVTPPPDVRMELSKWGSPRTTPWGGTQWAALLRELEREDPGYRS